MRRLLTLLLATVLLAACGSSERDSSGLAVGVVDDVVRTDPRLAGSLLDELVRSGFDSLAVTSIWEPGSSTPTADELATLRTVAAEAEQREVRLLVRLYHAGSGTTPLSEQARKEFAAYAAALAEGVEPLDDLIVGNEPNLNRFWLPQFGASGENVAAPAYLALLATTYDAVKAARDDVRVWGGATAPRGGDRPGGRRQTHSPTRFIRDLGAAFRASGRERPVMDGFVHHPYPESSRVPIDLAHPRTTSIGLADYDKLVALLGEAFDGTAQPGSELPLLYGEVGIETSVPPGKAAGYSGVETAPTTTAAAQASAYRRALELAACQPTVAGVLLFHLRDEPVLEGWQSGVRYVDGASKPSLPAVRAAATDAAEGTLDVRCEP
jgi:hypothetical protein